MNKKPTKADAEDALRKALVHLAGVPADSPSAQEQAVKLFYRFRDECKKGSNVPAGVFTHALHSEIDFRIEKAKTRTDLGARVTCTKGCAACCYQRVEITPQEGRVMLRAAKRINFPIDEARVRTQAKLSIEEFNGLAHADRRCVFLTEANLCAVYEKRPSACRKYLVVSDPNFCDIEKHPGHQVLVVRNASAEILHFAALSVMGLHTISSVLLEIIGDRDV